MNQRQQEPRTRYSLVQEIISSNYSTIYLAEDTSASPGALHRRVIIKRLHWDKFPGEKFKLYDEIRFQRLMRGHPNIGQILDSWEEGKDIILVLEYAQCGDLHNFMWRQRDQMTPERIQKILFQVLFGLNDLHKRGIMHRDIKPENILLDGFQDAKLIDFGWSAEIGNLVTNTEGAGTLTYMSPECLLKAPQNCATDIWSLGVLAYELYHYKEAFPAKDPDQAIELVTHTFPQIDPTKCPPEAQNLIESCLRYKAHERPKANQLLRHPLFSNLHGVVQSEPPAERQVMQLEPTLTESLLRPESASEPILEAESLKPGNDSPVQHSSGRRVKYTPITATRPLQRAARGGRLVQEEAAPHNHTVDGISATKQKPSPSQFLPHMSLATKPRLELGRRLDGSLAGAQITVNSGLHSRYNLPKGGLSASAVELHCNQTPQTSGFWQEKKLPVKFSEGEYGYIAQTQVQGPGFPSQTQAGFLQPTAQLHQVCVVHTEVLQHPIGIAPVWVQTRPSVGFPHHKTTELPRNTAAMAMPQFVLSPSGHFVC